MAKFAASGVCGLRLNLYSKPSGWPEREFEGVFSTAAGLARPARKIDAATALMMAVGRAMAEDTNVKDFMDFLRNPVIA